MLEKIKNIFLNIIKLPDPPKELIFDQSALAFEKEALQLLSYKGLKLRFPEKLEKEFQDYDINLRQHRYFLFGFIALIIYNLFCIHDYFILPKDYEAAWFIRVCSVSPLFLLIMFMIKSRRFKPAIDYLAVVQVFLIYSSSIIIYGYLKQAILHITYMLGLMIIIIFANIISRIRLGFAIAASLCIYIIYIIFNILLSYVSINFWINDAIMLLVIITISLIGNFQLEKESRRNVIFTLLLSIESIKLEKSNKILTRLSISDFLTGIANRRLLDETLEKEWRSGLRKKTPISIIFIDIDFFKPYNDNYGHQAGDECLKLISNVLRTYSRRPRDLCARYGGEEFVILLPEFKLSEAVELAEKIRQDIHKLNIKHEFNKAAAYVTVSMGVAETIPSPNFKYMHLFELGDNALYTAKTAGRDRICFPRTE
jgi:diguanylate cyclase (GGDEF)-like protein